MKNKQKNKDLSKKEIKIALAGNPNTGKSTLFNYLTGLGVIISNYPGTSVDLTKGRVEYKCENLNIVDLPGVYSLDASTDEEKVALDYITKESPDIIINVVDATLLERNLYLTLQLLKLKKPMIIALNFHEELADKGIEIDTEKLSKILNIPIIPIDALRGAGVQKLIEQSIEISKKESKSSAIDILSAENKKENSTKKAEKIHENASIISKKVITRKKPKKSFKESLDRITTEPLSGGIILILVLLSVFSLLYFLGGYLSNLLGIFFKYLTAPLIVFIESITNETIKTILLWSLDGVNAGLQIALPYIAVFYIIMGVLEDTGYLPRMAFLLDKAAHKLKMHGNVVIPLMLGFGCSVPAILSTRTIPSKKDRLFASILIILIPCSARSAVIFGAVGKFLGFWYVLLLYGILLLLITFSAYFLGKILPGKSEGLILEIPDYRMPYSYMFKKTWARVKEFVFFAFPLIILGSVTLGLFKLYGALSIIESFLGPFFNYFLLLPAVAGVTLIYGILRKELSLELLFVLAGSSNLLFIMTPVQIFIFALIISIYMPCLGTFAVLKKEFGLRYTLIISVFTIILAFIIGAVVGRILLYTHILA